MAYNPTQWEENDLLSIERMNKIEQGIAAASETPDGLLPSGGTTGQMLAKASDDDYDAEWVDAPEGGGGIETEITGNTNFFKLYGIDTESDSVELKANPSYAFPGTITVTKNDTLDDVADLIDAVKTSVTSDIYFDSEGALHFTNEYVGALKTNKFTSSDDSVTYVASPERILLLPQPMSKYPDDVASLFTGGSAEHENAFVDHDTIKKVMDFTEMTHEIYTGEENFANLYGIDLSTVNTVYFKYGTNGAGGQIPVNSTITVGTVANNINGKFSKVNGRIYRYLDNGETQIAKIYSDSDRTQELHPSYDRVYNPSIPAESITNIVVLTEEEHTALTTKPSTTLYLIPEEE